MSDTRLSLGYRALRMTILRDFPILTHFQGVFAESAYGSRLC
jgi:hypothetical protein